MNKAQSAIITFLAVASAFLHSCKPQKEKEDVVFKNVPVKVIYNTAGGNRMAAPDVGWNFPVNSFVAVKILDDNVAKFFDRGGEKYANDRYSMEVKWLDGLREHGEPFDVIKLDEATIKSLSYGKECHVDLRLAKWTTLGNSKSEDKIEFLPTIDSVRALTLGKAGHEAANGGSKGR